MDDDTPNGETPKDARGEIAFSPSIMACLSFLPVSKAGDTRSISRTNGRMSLTISAGRDGEWAYGRIPRLFILYIQTLIARRDPCVDDETRTVYIDGSFSRFCRRVGLGKSGQRERDVAEQIAYLARMDFIVVQDLSDSSATVERSSMFHFADDVKISFPMESGARNYIRLSEPMWQMLSGNRMPVDLRAVAGMGKSARAIDILLWLEYRMHTFRGDSLHLTWDQLARQFDGGETGRYNFRKKFKAALEIVESQCPELSVDVDRTGITVRRARAAAGSPDADDAPQDDDAPRDDDVEHPEERPLVDELMRDNFRSLPPGIGPDTVRSLLVSHMERNGLSADDAVRETWEFLNSGVVQ